MTAFPAKCCAVLLIGHLPTAAMVGLALAEPPPVRFRAEPLPDYDALFTRTRGWTGADCSASVALSRERTLWLYGEPDNSAEPFYVGLEDSAGTRKDITHPDQIVLTVNHWQQWRIPLADFTDVDLTAIKVMYIGVGDPTSNQPGGSGLVRIDDIELHLPSMP